MALKSRRNKTHGGNKNRRNKNRTVNGGKRRNRRNGGNRNKTKRNRRN